MSPRPYALITVYDSYMEMLTALRMSERARRSGHHRAADDFFAQALALAEEIAGEGR